MTLTVRRVLTAKESTELVGTYPGKPLEPTVPSPRTEADFVRVADADTGDVIAVITRLPEQHRRALRRTVTGLKYGQGVARHKMRNIGATFGYAPPKPMARQEGCRMTMTGRDFPEEERALEAAADHLAREFETILPAQAGHDAEVVTGSVLKDWRLGERSLWTSGVINQMNVLPYHRDGNNLDMWSAMPTLRYGMAGGHLHLPEYDLVFPCGDGDVTWFYGRGFVHGNTPLRRLKPGGYRYSIVYYALKGMTDCATHAEETARAQQRRTMRERAEADKVRRKLGLDPGAGA